MIRFAPSMCCEVNTVCNDVCVLHRFNFVGYIGTYSECSRHWCVYGFFPFCFPVSCMHLFVQSRNTVLNVTVPEYQTAKAQKERERKHIRIKDEVSSEFFYVLSVFVLLLWLSTSHINLKQRETIPNKNAHKQNAISSCFLLLLFYFVLLLSLSFDLFIYFSPTQMPLCVFFLLFHWTKLPSWA